MTADMSTGDLRHRIRIEKSQRSPDGAGGATLAWHTLAEVWAAVWPRAVTEQFAQDRVAGSATHDIWIRYRPNIVPEMRIRWGTRLFDIRGVIDVEERRRWLKCIVEERDL